MEELNSATLGGGCFWCLEAVYTRLEGVNSVVSGYAGGTLKILLTSRFALVKPLMLR
ncbi:MAG: hypothetical protein Ct9H300mP28_29990 [Pseudomonadota bacterium]|nr:MAG: hypothetical protein Ct9H300mP28_29990 [Pseudomonadota bacterium]